MCTNFLLHFCCMKLHSSTYEIIQPFTETEREKNNITKQTTFLSPRWNNKK